MLTPTNLSPKARAVLQANARTSPRFARPTPLPRALEDFVHHNKAAAANTPPAGSPSPRFLRDDLHAYDMPTWDASTRLTSESQWWAGLTQFSDPRPKIWRGVWQTRNKMRRQPERR